MKFFRVLSLAVVSTILPSHVRASGSGVSEIIISVKRQTMTVIQNGARAVMFPVSTSKFGVGDQARSFRTPLGEFHVEKKVGANLPPGAVFKSLRFTGEVVAPNSPGRDPIVSRVLCLGGGNAGKRGIYIHGTPQERSIGRPASYGCIRMRSRDVIALFDAVPVGTPVLITDAPTYRFASASDSRPKTAYR